MASNAATKTKATPAGDLTQLEINKITDQLVTLRENIRDTGGTALNPSPEWDRLRKEIAALNKILNSDKAAKLKAALSASPAPN